MQNTIAEKLGRPARDWAASISPWTNVYGLARTLLALGTAGTLLFNEPGLLFRPGSGVVEYPICSSMWKFGLFCQFSPYLGLARWVAAAVLLLAASGWRPRWTAIPHWYVAFSFQTSAITLDGGDQAAAVLTLLLLPLALTDKRRWHWQSPKLDESLPLGELMRRLVGLSAVSAIRLQVAIIYLHAAVAKWAVEEWTDGTILYYWFQNSMIGLPDWLRPLLMPLMTSRAVALVTWGSLILEFGLFMALVMPKKRWRVMLPLGIAFHATIALTMGLISFGLSMTAALILYLRPVEQEFALSMKTRALARRARGWFKGGHVEQESPNGEGVPAPSGA
jgi:antimicrobial peptide system SdpB family protein